MTRSPDGIRAREFMVTARMSTEDRRVLDENRAARGDTSNSTYLRRLIHEDAARIRRGTSRKRDG